MTKLITINLAIYLCLFASLSCRIYATEIIYADNDYDMQNIDPDLKCIDRNLQRTLRWKAGNVSDDFELLRYQVEIFKSIGHSYYFLPLTCYKDDDRTIEITDLNVTECKVDVEEIMPFNYVTFRVISIYKVGENNETRMYKLNECQPLQNQNPDLKCIDRNLQRTLKWKAENVSDDFELLKYEVEFSIGYSYYFLPLACYKDDDRTIEITDLNVTECKVDVEIFLPYNYVSLSAPILQLQRTTTSISVFLTLPSELTKSITTLYDYDLGIIYYFCLFKDEGECRKPYSNCKPYYTNITLEPGTNYTVKSWYMARTDKRIKSDNATVYTKTLDDPFPQEAQLALFLTLFGCLLLASSVFGIWKLFKTFLKEPSQLLKLPIPDNVNTIKCDYENKAKEPINLLCCCNWDLLQAKESNEEGIKADADSDSSSEIINDIPNPQNANNTQNLEDVKRTSIYENFNETTHQPVQHGEFEINKIESKILFEDNKALYNIHPYMREMWNTSRESQAHHLIIDATTNRPRIKNDEPSQLLPEISPRKLQTPVQTDEDGCAIQTMARNAQKSVQNRREHLPNNKIQTIKINCDNLAKSPVSGKTTSNTNLSSVDEPHFLEMDVPVNYSPQFLEGKNNPMSSTSRHVCANIDNVEDSVFSLAPKTVNSDSFSTDAALYSPK
ncbi:uncharacterized protein LOC120334927 isoform X2 [Styela clava]|uniref:uncharacterized protein LOC120334927 isoform X2 n=1 Tax=Styela clava TaxID=7725 RepID=UPI00193ACAA8|nr:uncharacterized protein LOC120334927 isoform X2 [Styela clava]